MENTTTEVLAHDGDFWLQEGSIVLVANKTAFKVYKGVLSAHSPIFADMFSSATHADEVCDGCPVVRVSDSPQDLKWLLTYLIPTTLLYLKGRPDPQYPVVSALTRLGHKYQIDVLERYGIGQLKRLFTNDVEEWESLVRSSKCPWIPIYSRCNPIDVINIARLTNNPGMLPLAFCLCVQNEDIIIDGQAREDGTHLVLKKADVRRCISAIRHLSQTSERAIQQTRLLVASPPCSTQAACRGALDAALYTTDNNEGLCIYLFEELHRNIVYCSFSGCSRCSQAVKRLRQAQRRELWKKLPEIFGLQDELKGHWPGC